jgi:nucleotide-binding universal stress UspA family protein
MPDRIAYLPLDSYPEAAADDAIRAAVAYAKALDCRLHVTAFAVKIPPVAAPLGGFLINVEAMARAAETTSRATCERLHALISDCAGPAARYTVREVDLGGAHDAATLEARRFDFAVVPWSADSVATRDLAQALAFGAGHPVFLVPAGAAVRPLDNAAIAWDESRAAARALADVLPFLTKDARVTVLTVGDEKALKSRSMAGTLAESLQQRGLAARAVEVSLQGRPIAEALQAAALAEGAALLVMGAFGHSRLRDFVLGGATLGVLSDLRLPVLMSH